MRLLSRELMAGLDRSLYLHHGFTEMRTLTCALITACASFALAGSWTPAQLRFSPSGDLHPSVAGVQAAKTFKLDVKRFEAELSQAPKEFSQFTADQIIELPYPDGKTRRFKIVNSPILSPELAQRIPIQTYAVQGVDDPYAHGRVDFGKFGFHGTVFSPTGDFTIEPLRRSNITDYFTYFRYDQVFKTQHWGCRVEETKITPEDGFSGIQTTGPDLKTYRLALNTTTEYTNFFGSVAAAEAAAVTSVNRVTGVYEKDVAIRLNLTFLRTWTGTDPFTNNDAVAQLAQNQSNLDSVVGNANYDVGHVFSTAAGGVAGLGVVGLTGQKARGATGVGAPVGDGFDIDFVAHELGHQFNANHTFNGTTLNCGGGNRSAGNAYEPGSGTTIMAYAGICGAENVQNNSDPYFHTRSIDSILTLRGNAARGGTTTSTGNLAPIVDAGVSRTIPLGTPFKITAVGSDPNGDPLTYCWEQFNLGTASPTTDNTTRPLFRSFNPATSPTRFFPRLADVLSGAATPWEILPTVARTLNFRCTVRDNRVGGGGVETDVTIWNATGAAMSVTSPNTNVQWFANSRQTVTWNVGSSSVPSPNVRILLSTNGGNSFGTGTATVLAANVPNTGSAVVTLPNISNTTSRIFVESQHESFYDVSNVNFRISQATVSGRVNLSNWSATTTGIPVTFELFPAGGTSPIQTITTTLNSTGSYSFVAGIPTTGQYDLRAKASHWLGQKLSPVTVSATGAINVNFTLINGDVDGDNEVGGGDLSELSSAFQSVAGDPNWNVNADLDGDGEVGSSDLSILSSVFGLSGD